MIHDTDGKEQEQEYVYRRNFSVLEGSSKSSQLGRSELSWQNLPQVGPLVVI